MPRSLFLLCALLVNAECEAQWWMDAGLPVDASNEVTQLYVDGTTNTLYVTGTLAVLSDSTGASPRYCTYENGAWNISDPFDHFVLTSVVFHDTLYVGGVFSTVDGIPLNHIARRVNGQWSSAGGFDNTVLRLKVINDELYAVGQFTYVDGQLCQGLAKRSGGAWEPVVPIGCDYCSVTDVELFNGSLYVTGTILFPGNPYRHVMRLQQDAWLPVGGTGLFGGLSAGNILEVYGEYLYLGGLFQLSDGNPGDAIMRWDGEAWSPVGTGVQDETGGYDQWIQVTDLQVHDGLLYVAGGFTYAGNMPANRVATWNGSQWCSVGGDFGEWPATAIGFHNDTLYAGCWYEADGQPVNHLAKFIATAYEGNCSIPMAVAESNEAQPELQTLGYGRYRLAGHRGERSAMLFNSLGQKCRAWVIHGEATFGFSGVQPGTYFVAAQGLPAAKLIILE